MHSNGTLRPMNFMQYNMRTPRVSAESTPAYIGTSIKLHLQLNIICEFASPIIYLKILQFS
ncbi:hypothetical protein PILCRDRAFT_15873 [Piloderma croceum F 1598]|uniref:Uncharacterized protein n=1 Tax=Piloderma croceum (strain F 1598) TaxID=765440 RepID=A0A0C3B5Y3_PILCF|nr:hypothetical protein PILCRDRAFT_15873 [Piloderma croceum F 1598]